MGNPFLAICLAGPFDASSEALSEHVCVRVSTVKQPTPLLDGLSLRSGGSSPGLPAL